MVEKGNIGLALGGGAVLGAAHIGVLKAIDETGIKVKYISGTSIGAFVAALYAFEKSWTEIKEIALELNWPDITGLNLSKMGLLSNEKLGKLITEHIGNKNIEESNIPLAIVATNISNGEKIILNKGSIADAVMASTGIPGIFIPTEIESKLLVDGGLVENVPVNTLKELGPDYLIGIDLNAKHTYQKPNNIIEVLLNSFHFMMLASAKLLTLEADLMIKPDLNEFNRSNIDQVEDLIEKGYEAAKKALKKEF